DQDWRAASAAYAGLRAERFFAANHGGVGGGGGPSIVLRCCPTQTAQTLRAVVGGVGWHNRRACQSRGNLRRLWAAYRGSRRYHHLLARGQEQALSGAAHGLRYRRAVLPGHAADRTVRG